MHLDFTAVNWVAILVAAVVGLVIGFIWFAPQLFGRQWARAAGVELRAPGQVPPMTVAIGALGLLVTAYVLEVLASAMGAASVVDGGMLGLVGWLGFVAPWTLVWVLYERRPAMYFYLTAGEGLVALVVMGAIIGYFG